MSDTKSNELPMKSKVCEAITKKYEKEQLANIPTVRMIFSFDLQNENGDSLLKECVHNTSERMLTIKEAKNLDVSTIMRSVERVLLDCYATAFFSVHPRPSDRHKARLVLAYSYPMHYFSEAPSPVRYHSNIKEKGNNAHAKTTQYPPFEYLDIGEE